MGALIKEYSSFKYILCFFLIGNMETSSWTNSSFKGGDEQMSESKTKENKVAQMVKNTLAPHFYLPCFLRVFQSWLLTTTKRWVIVFSSLSFSSLKHKGSMGLVSTSSINNSYLIPCNDLGGMLHQMWMGCRVTDTGFSLEWFRCMGKICQRFNSGRIFHSILQIVQL